MHIYLAIWDTNEGTTVEHYWSEEDRSAAVKTHMTGLWDRSRDGPPPDDFREMWPVLIERGCEDWVVLAEIDTNQPDTADLSSNLTPSKGAETCDTASLR